MELLITFLAGISILFGAAFIRLSHNTEKIEHLSIATALSALLSLMIFDLLPEVAESASGIGWGVTVLFVIGGIALLKFLDRLVPDHEDTEANHDRENAAHIGLISALAVILHNIIEGMTVYSLSLASTRQGFIFALGIALHNIPMGMLIESTTEQEPPKKHFAVLSSVSLSTLIGGLLMMMVSDYLTDTVVGILVCIATGMIIYITFLELLPHVLKTKEKALNFIGAALGFLLVLASSVLA